MELVVGKGSASLRASGDKKVKLGPVTSFSRTTVLHILCLHLWFPHNLGNTYQRAIGLCSSSEAQASDGGSLAFRLLLRFYIPSPHFSLV